MKTQIKDLKENIQGLREKASKPLISSTNLNIYMKDNKGI